MSLKRMVGNVVRGTFRRMGYAVLPADLFRAGMEEEFFDLYQHCRDFTMTGTEPMYALYKAVEYVVKNRIPGDVVECGVWRGGSSMLAARALRKFSDVGRDLYLYDTFAGMSEPTAADVDYRGATAASQWQPNQCGDKNLWALATQEEVSQNMRSTGYPAERIHLVKGKVEDTIPGTLPAKISLLRLDTDWYESTAHELEHLYPLLSPGGVLIIDDYGFWSGSRKATDEYMAAHNLPLYLSRIDQGVRLSIKPFCQPPAVTA